MYAFQLWREYKLSLAEIYALFPTAQYLHTDTQVAVIDGVSRDDIFSKADSMGWVIKIIELEEDFSGKPWDILLRDAEDVDGKFIYGISVFWKNTTKEVLLQTKKFLKTHDISPRFVNKNFGTLSSAQILWEKLVSKWTDYSLIYGETEQYFGKTIWVQDIDAYSQRDYGKTRDMQVGMLPPKLAQVMINLAYDPHLQEQKIYDPFCWLGTVLIESAIRWDSDIFGSDISPENVNKTRENIEFTQKHFKTYLNQVEIFVFDARNISHSLAIHKCNTIVTEGYLWPILHKTSISEVKIWEIKKELETLYKDFFAWLKKSNFTWNIVISFPFWEIQWKYFYFNEIYSIINKYCRILPLLPHDCNVHCTKYGSLLYKRNNQVVGREIFKLQML